MQKPEPLLAFIQAQHERRRFRDFLNSLGYRDINRDDFGLNQWTSLLVTPASSRSSDSDQNESPLPPHLVSFLLFPFSEKIKLFDVPTAELIEIISKHQWKRWPGLDAPFQHTTAQPCGEGLLIPHWIPNQDQQWLQAFILIRPNGILEYGLGREAINIFEGGTYFQLVRIVGRLWQLLDLSGALFSGFLSDEAKISVFVNLRGTKGAFMSDLAEGWRSPIGPPSHRIYRPICYESNLQFQKEISAPALRDEMDELVYWFATRIENAWGQLLPRCYAYTDTDERGPFIGNRRY